MVVGLGARGQRERLTDVEAHFREEGIALEQMDTANAVHTFNILNDEGGRSAALFLNSSRGASTSARTRSRIRLLA